MHLFEFKRFSTWGERDKISFYADFSILTPARAAHFVDSQLVSPWRGPKINLPFLIPKLDSDSPNQRAAPVAHKVVWSRPGLNLNYCFFFQIPQILSASVHDVIHVPGHISIWGFYRDISDCHIHPARAWTPALN